MKMPGVKVDDIIKIGIHFGAPQAQVVHVYTEEEKHGGVFGDIEVVYYQNKIKGIKEDVVWDEQNWKFKNEGPSGAYVNINEYPKLK